MHISEMGLNVSKIDFWRSICVRTSKTLNSVHFEVGNSKMKSVSQYSQNVTTCCDVTIPYLDIKGMNEGQKSISDDVLELET